MPKIKNFDSLAKSGLRRAALAIAEAGFEAIDTGAVIRDHIKLDGSRLTVGENNFDLEKIGKIVLLGVGKCAFDAMKEIENILGGRIAKGVALDIKEKPDFKYIEGIKGTHPLPTEANVRGAVAIVDALKGLSEKDLVIFVVSGGGSTLLCLPEDAGCEEEAKIVRALTRAGADINEMNTVRKHLSLARGGYLSQYAYPANAIALIFSDVPGNDMQFIASGPTVKDETTVEDAEKILAKYDVLRVCGIEKCGLVETPKEEKYFEKIENIIAVSNERALSAMHEAALRLGFAATIQSTTLAGEARDAAADIAKKLNASPAKTALLYGGETTVTVRGHGKGGRSMECALSALRFLKEGELFMGIASDGRDNSDYAGAIADTLTKKRADELGLDIDGYLDENNEYPFFEKTADYLLTGDTGSNVSDLVIAIKE